MGTAAVCRGVTSRLVYMLLITILWLTTGTHGCPYAHNSADVLEKDDITCDTVNVTSPEYPRPGLCTQLSRWGWFINTDDVTTVYLRIDRTSIQPVVQMELEMRHSMYITQNEALSQLVTFEFEGAYHQYRSAVGALNFYIVNTPLHQSLMIKIRYPPTSVVHFKSFYITEIKLYVLKEAYMPLLTDTHVLYITCSTNTSCQRLYDTNYNKSWIGDYDQHSTSNLVELQYMNVTFVETKVLFWGRIFLKANQCVNRTFNVTARCAGGDMMILASKDKLTQTEGLADIISFSINQITTDFISITFDCGGLLVEIMEVELYGNSELQSTTEQADTSIPISTTVTYTSSTIPAVTTTSSTIYTSPSQATVSDTTTSTGTSEAAHLTSTMSVDQATLAATTDVSTVVTANITIMPTNQTTTPIRQVQGIHEIFFKTTELFRAAYSNHSSDMYSNKRDQYLGILTEAYLSVTTADIDKAFINILQAMIFSPGSIGTTYTVNFADPIPTNNDTIKRDIVNSITDTFKKNNITVDPNSFIFLDKSPTEAPPQPSPNTETVLLAGVLGSVLTLLVVSIAITAVVLRMCIKNRGRRNDNGEDSFPPIHRNEINNNVMFQFPTNQFSNSRSYPAFMSSSFRRPNQRSGNNYQHRENPPPHYERQGSGEPPPLFEFPTPMGMGYSGRPGRGGGSDRAYDSPASSLSGIGNRDTARNNEQNSRTNREELSNLGAYVPQHTEIPALPPSRNIYDPNTLDRRTLSNNQSSHPYYHYFQGQSQSRIERFYEQHRRSSHERRRSSNLNSMETNYLAQQQRRRSEQENQRNTDNNHRDRNITPEQTVHWVLNDRNKSQQSNQTQVTNHRKYDRNKSQQSDHTEIMNSRNDNRNKLQSDQTENTDNRKPGSPSPHIQHNSDTPGNTSIHRVLPTQEGHYDIPPRHTQVGQYDVLPRHLREIFNEPAYDVINPTSRRGTGTGSQEVMFRGADGNIHTRTADTRDKQLRLQRNVSRESEQTDISGHSTGRPNGHVSSGANENDFDDDALTPYYMVDEPETSGGFFGKISKTLSLRMKSDSNKRVHRKQPNYMRETRKQPTSKKQSHA